MKRILFFIMAIMVAISGWSQALLVEDFSSATFPPTGWTRLSGLASDAFTGTAPTTTTSGWLRVTTGYGISNAHPKVNIYGTTCKYWLVTPTLDLGTGGNYAVSFDLAITKYNSANPAPTAETRADDKFMVIISTDAGLTWQMSNATIWDNQGATRVFNNIPNVAQNISLDLSAYSGQIQIAFYAESTVTSNGDNDLHIGNVEVTTCPMPSGLIANSLSPSSSEITWNTSDALEYTLEYKPASDTLWTSAISVPSILTNSYIVQGLPANTLYTYRVKASCNPGVDESAWKTSTFRTACEVITSFPWIEGFEDSFNTSAVVPGNIPAPFCWYVIDSLNTSTYNWKTIASAHSGTKAIYMYGYSGASSGTTETYKNNDWLISPVLSLTGGERLNFWSKKSSTSYFPDLLVYAMDVSQGDLNATASNANFVLIGSIDTLLLTTTYAEYEFNLSNLVGEHRLAFVRKKMASGSVYIDDVKVSLIPACFTPTQLVASDIGTTQVDISWTPASANDFAWSLVVKNLTTNLTEVVQAYSYPHTLVDLTPNTNYDISIMTECDDASFSDVSLPITIRTNCVSEAIPYVENFSTSVVVEPTCWKRMIGLLDQNTVLTPTTSGWTHTPDVNGSMRVNIYGTSIKNWLISPSFDLGYDGSLYQLDFDVVYADLTTGLGEPTHSDDDKFAVVISTDNGNTWSSANAVIWYASPDSVNTLTALTPTSTHISIKLEDRDFIPYSGDIKIGLYAESTVALSGADNYLFVDNFKVDLAPSCPLVFGTVAEVKNFTTIGVNFATDNAEPGITWDIAYAETDASGFIPDASSIVQVNDALELPYLLTGLNSGGTYSFAVRQSCGGEWSDVVSSTIPLVQSTVSLPYTQDFEDLLNVSEWNLSNPDSNKWYISSAVSYPEATQNSLNISNTLGTTNSYSMTSASYAYASTLVDFGTGTEYSLSFDWKGMGESTYDFMRVYLLPIDQSIPTTGFPVGQDISGLLNQQATWQHAEYIFPASEYENTIKRLVFVWRNDGSGGTTPPAAVDNIQILALACPTPTNLVVSSITQTSAELSWDDGGYASQWLIEYSNDGTTWQSQTSSTHTNYILSGLNHSSTYLVKVYALCSSTDTSVASTITFNTPCSTIIQLPWNEGFEVISVANQLPNCWSSTSLGTHTSTQTSNLTYNRMPRTGTNSASFRYGSNDKFTTPSFELFAGNNYVFTFWYVTDGKTGWQSLQARVVNANDTNINHIIGSPVLNAIDTIYKQFVSGFSPAVDGTYKFNIECQATGSPWYLTFDDVKLEESNCGIPENVSLANLTPTSVDMAWNIGTSTQWTVEHKVSSDSTWISDITSTNTYSFTNLLPQTAYDVRVASLCGTENSYFAYQSLTTPCSAISSIPWVESFDTYGTGTAAYPDCWSRLNTSTTVMPYINSTNNSAPGSLYSNAPAGTYNIAISPEIDSSIPINTLTATFWMRKSNGTSNVIVGVMTDLADASTFDSIALIAPTASSSWEEFEVDFASYNGLGRYIAFKSEYNTTTNTIYIDDLVLDYTPSCAKPAAITATSTINSIDVTITPGNSSDTEWYIFFKEEASNVWDSIYTATNPTSIINLLPQTSYELYAKTVCFDGTKSKASPTLYKPTQQTAEQIPYFTDFEAQGDNGWLLRSGACLNKWMIGTPTGGASNSLFVSGNNADATYTLNAFSVVVAEKLFEFTSSDSVQLSFDLTIGGESTFDYLKVFLVDKDTVFNPSTINTYFSVNSYAPGVIMKNGANNYINLLSGTQTLSTTFMSPGVGEQRKLVFVWRNDASAGNGQSSIIDNVSLTNNVGCPSPTNLVATPDVTSADLSWNSITGTEIGWQVREGLAGVETNVSIPLYTVIGLTANTQYTFYVRSECSAGVYSPWVSVSFTTLPIGVIHPTATTTPATSITESDATLNGIITAGTETITAQGFEWKASSASTWTIVTEAGTAITHNLVGLTQNTAYEFRAFATTATTTVYGTTENFTTLTAAVIPPIVLTNPATLASGREATLNGTVNAGSESIISQGFDWKSSTESEWTRAAATLIGDAMTHTLTGLTPSATYDFKAYAITESGSTFGAINSFTTLGLNGADGQEISIMMYPNPATSQTKLVVNGVNGETKIILSDVQGRVLNTINTKPTSGVLEQTINLSNLAKGIYYIRIQNSDINRTQKLIVK